MSSFEGLPVRHGHFLLESGLHASSWIDLDTLFLDPRALSPHFAALASRLAERNVTAICGPLLGGAFVAQAVAAQLGVRFYYAEPQDVEARDGLFQAIYRLPASQRARASAERFAVVDDIIRAGSSVRATINELSALGANVAVVGALMTLSRTIEEFLTPKSIPLVALSFREISMWRPEQCPQCHAGAPIESTT
jgi:orotate phosphoribosyltransferase